MDDHTAELIAMRIRHDAITAERDLITDPARIDAIDMEIDTMSARLDELGIGDLPGGRGWTWHSGVITCVDDERSHLLVAIRLNDGTRTTATMLVDDEDDGSFEAVLAMIGKPARLRLGRYAPGECDQPAGVDRSLPLIDVVSTARDAYPAPSYLRTVGLHG